MTAGMVRVPTIVPLRPPSSSRKNMIDTRTPVEILSETAGALIYYTVNGTKPNPFQKIGEKFTYRYYRPFVLGPGKRTVKAMATSSDGTRESSIVTKMFLVEEAIQDERNDDEISDEFQGRHEYTGNMSNSMKSMSLSKSRSMPVEPSRNGWANHDEKRSTNDGHRKTKGERFGRRDDVKSPEYLSLLLDGSHGGGSFQDSRDRGPPEAEFSKCIYCFAPRPSDPYSTYCNDCGSLLPQPSSARLAPPHSYGFLPKRLLHHQIPTNVDAISIH